MSHPFAPGAIERHVRRPRGISRNELVIAAALGLAFGTVLGFARMKGWL